MTPSTTASSRGHRAAGRPPGHAPQRPYVATMAQVWALHDALPDHTRQALLLGAFTGLRTNEGVALRVSDIDFMRGVVSWAIQHLAEPLKSETSRTAVPIREQLALELAAYVQCYGGSTVVTDEIGLPSSPVPRRPGRPCGRCVRRGLVFRGLRRSSGSTTFSTTSPHCSSRPDSTSRSCRRASGTRAPPRRSTPTVIFGRTATSRHGPPWRMAMAAREDNLRTERVVG